MLLAADQHGGSETGAYSSIPMGSDGISTPSWMGLEEARRQPATTATGANGGRNLSQKSIRSEPILVSSGPYVSFERVDTRAHEREGHMWDSNGSPPPVEAHNKRARARAHVNSGPFDEVDERAFGVYEAGEKDFDDGDRRVFVESREAPESPLSCPEPDHEVQTLEQMKDWIEEHRLRMDGEESPDGDVVGQLDSDKHDQPMRSKGVEDHWLRRFLTRTYAASMCFLVLVLVLGRSLFLYARVSMSPFFTRVLRCISFTCLRMHAFVFG